MRQYIATPPPRIPLPRIDPRQVALPAIPRVTYGVSACADCQRQGLGALADLTASDWALVVGAALGAGALGMGAVYLLKRR